MTIFSNGSSSSSINSDKCWCSLIKLSICFTILSVSSMIVIFFFSTWLILFLDLGNSEKVWLEKVLALMVYSFPFNDLIFSWKFLVFLRAVLIFMTVSNSFWGFKKGIFHTEKAASFFWCKIYPRSKSDGGNSPYFLPNQGKVFLALYSFIASLYS